MLPQLCDQPASRVSLPVQTFVQPVYSRDEIEEEVIHSITVVIWPSSPLLGAGFFIAKKEKTLITDSCSLSLSLQVKRLGIILDNSNLFSLISKIFHLCNIGPWTHNQYFSTTQTQETDHWKVKFSIGNWKKAEDGVNWFEFGKGEATVRLTHGVGCPQWGNYRLLGLCYCCYCCDFIYGEVWLRAGALK